MKVLLQVQPLPPSLLNSTMMVWCLKVSASCIASVFVGSTLVSGFREICKKTAKQLKLITGVFLCPICVFLILNYASKHQLCDRVVADAFSFGVVLGILYRLNFSLPTGLATVKLIAHSLDGRVETVWLDSTESTAGEARTKLATALQQPVVRIYLESGKGSLIEDMDEQLLPILNESVRRDFFGFTTAQCHFSLRDEASHDGATGGNGGKKRSFMSMIGITGKVIFGQNLTLTAKVYSKNEDNRDVRALTISPIDKFAAAAPSRALMSAQMRLLSWHSVKLGDSELFSEMDGSESGLDLSTSGSSSPGRSSKFSQVTGKLVKRNLDSSLPIRNGDMVVVESEGKFMAVAKGWWISWCSPTPRRSGAFKIEILERGEGLEQQLQKGLTRLNTSMMNISKQVNFAPETKSKSSSPIDADAILRTGDMFRLRSMKFPDYELGVTSDKITGDYCYLGLRKVDAVDDKGGEEWCMPVCFSLRRL